MIKITKDNFVWLDVTKQCVSQVKTKELFDAQVLYEVFEDESESLIEDPVLVKYAIQRGSRICIEVGKLPKKYQPKKVWDGTDKELIDGHWFVKMANILNIKNEDN